MKKSTKKKEACCGLASCHKPALGLCLVRVGVALIFLIPGVMKVMHPEMFMGMLKSLYGVSGGSQQILFWLVAGTEVLGGLVLLAGSVVPMVIYRFFAVALFIIIMMAIGSVHYPAFVANKAALIPLLLHVQLALAILALVVTKPMCPCGATGCTDKK